MSAGLHGRPFLLPSHQLQRGRSTHGTGRQSRAGQPVATTMQHQILNPERGLRCGSEIARRLVAQADCHPTCPPDHPPAARQRDRPDVTGRHLDRGGGPVGEDLGGAFDGALGQR